MQGEPQAQSPLCFVSLHPHHHNKTDASAFGRIESSAPWQPVTISLVELIEHISAGKAWVNCQLVDGKRNSGAFLASNLIVLDVDGDLDLDAFWAIPFAQRHCAFTYTSCSHGNTAKQEADGTPSADRYRAVFIAEPIDNADGQGVELHRERYFLLLEQLGLTLKDESPAKAAQLWYGNDAAELRFGDAKPLGWEFSCDARERLGNRHAQRQIAAATAPVYGDDGLDEQRAVYLLDHLLRPSEDGEFPHYWVAVFNACASSGSELVREAFMDWHSRGHHSKTQKRIEKRYDKAGGRSGLGKLFALAKEQYGSDWRQQLPDELRQSRGIKPPQPRVIFSEASPTIHEPIQPTAQPPAVEPAEGSAPDLVPPLDALEKLQAKAPRSIFSEFTDHNASPPPAAGASAAAPGEPELKNLLRELYLLRTFGTRTDGDQTVLVPSHEQPVLDRQLLGQILENKGYCNSPAEIERDLVGLYRQEHGLMKNIWAPVQSHILDGVNGARAQWLVPNWILARREHVLYSRAGVGKTMLSIQLARGITGDPSLNEFLDSGPITGYERWGRNRVLFIGTDMYDSAEEMTNTYLSSLGLEHADFLQYIDWWFEDGKAGTPGWTLSLRHLTQLYRHLEQQQQMGIPVSAVIIDSMKAVCPEHLLVGQQAFKDYLRLVYDICARFDAALIWIHHSGKDGGAQGIQRITEGAAGVFRMERDKDTNQVVMEVEKLRGGGRSRKLFINPFSSGAPTVLTNPNPEQDEDQPVVTTIELRRRDILHLLTTDLAHYRQDNPEDSASKLRLLYRGMAPREIANDLPGILPRQLERVLPALVEEGLIERLGHGRSITYRLRLDEDGQAAGGFDLFTASGD